MKSCFFIGHREADERLLPKLKNAIERLITEEDVSYFYIFSISETKCKTTMKKNWSWG